MAHVFETTSRFEPHTQTCIQSVYGVKAELNRKRKHHNALWRAIYRDLKTISSFQKVGDVSSFETTDGIDIYYRGVT